MAGWGEREDIRNAVRGFQFRGLFNILGWDNFRDTQYLAVDGQDVALKGVAQKAGLGVYVCESEAAVRDQRLRRKVERALDQVKGEKLVVFVDPQKTRQVWQWVKKEPGRPPAYREQAYRAGGPDELLVQKLKAIAFDIVEAGELRSVADVAERTRGAFDVERVTRKFYTEFKNQHDRFLAHIQGMAEADRTLAEQHRRWYASLMLNRLMFVYFVQKRGFLANDPDYLRNRLKLVQQRRGKGQFLSFYRFFLRRFFHEGLGAPRDRWEADMLALVGDVPYLNGGLFDEHMLEKTYQDLDVPDEAFAAVFDFFDRYDWRLDVRPDARANEINPDVLGYIFEKYVNQKQMGAYYTKEDITEYIARNTILPFVFDQAEKGCKVAFEPDGGVWRLLRENPDDFIFASVRKGVDVPLPPEIEAGVEDVSQRGGWNRPAAEPYALPTETWREHVARRQRCLEVRRKLRDGEVRSIDDLVTLNLDIRRFAQVVIENAEGPELVRSFWLALAGRVPKNANEKWRQGVSVLDPTCGSGAFLFAALNVLLPLYEACLERMKRFVDDLDLQDPQKNLQKLPDFRDTLARMAAAHNPRYFMLKSIILENLYGVDIMEEAVEICKLRLFLKLVAQLETGQTIEPLPDIDFNIRAGNTLVGFATREQVRQAVTTSGQQARLVFGEDESELKAIEDAADDVDRQFKLFRQQQLGVGGQVTAGDKAALGAKFAPLREKLHGLLARQYGKDPTKPKELEAWRKSHQPFHWFVEFFGIVGSGGFDVTIGNPPYVEYSKIRREYSLTSYSTLPSGNLYAYTIERSYEIMCGGSRFGFIVQSPIVSTKRMELVRSLLQKKSARLWYSTFDDRPSKLFDGIEHCRVAICLSLVEAERNAQIFTTKYHKWYSDERESLFERIEYTPTRVAIGGVVPKIRSELEASVLSKLREQPCYFGQIPESAGPCRIFYKITGVGHWFTFTPRPPRFWRNGVEGSSSRESSLAFQDERTRDTALSVLVSSLFYWHYQMKTNCRDLNPSDISEFRIPEALVLGTSILSELGKSYWHAVEASVSLGTGSYEIGGSVAFEKFSPKVAKPVADEIDRSLAIDFGINPEEIDFILNYDIKYRMGADSEFVTTE